MPSNEGRGYVLRRLLRRAARHGKKLGIEGKFMAELSKTVIALSKDGYPELEEKSAMIFKVLSEEEDKFNKTIDQGLAILADMETEMAKNNETVLSGDNAFKLYDTYGFPIDLTREILEEKNLSLDEDGFTAAMKKQKEQAKMCIRDRYKSDGGPDEGVYPIRPDSNQCIQRNRGEQLKNHVSGN